MDINKEREAFEQALVNQKNVSINNLHVCTIFDAEKNKYSPSDVCDPKEDFIVDWINSSWSIWQAAKAQAVPEWISVGDSLPPVDEAVLVCWDYAADIEPEKEYLTLDEDYNEYWPNCQDEPPTHWLPLPKVIKAQESANEL